MSIYLFVKRTVPAHLLRKASAFLRHGPADAWDWIRGRTDPLVPPRSRTFVGGGSYEEIGEEFFGHFRRLCGVDPGSRVLDIGCGIGRMARPFVPFLEPGRGSYDGFDIDAGGIRWCQAHYAHLPHFRFQRVDIRNDSYNPGGTVEAEDFRFPYPDGSLDFAFATSLFTHLRTSATARYIRETRRVLRPGGKALFTAYVWNEESKGLVAQGRSILPFRESQGLVSADPVVPENSMAIAEADLVTAVREAGLVLDGPVLWGSWCGRANGTTTQDVVLVRKPA
jgi:SAM-dependent methyltransferase